MLDGIEAVLENRASQDQMSYSIAGRSLSRMSIDDLLTFRARYRAEYLKELKLKRIKNKQDTGNTIKVRFYWLYGIDCLKAEKSKYEEGETIKQVIQVIYLLIFLVHLVMQTAISDLIYEK